MNITEAAFEGDNLFAERAAADAGHLAADTAVTARATLGVALEVARLREAVLTLVDELRARR